MPDATAVDEEGSAGDGPTASDARVAVVPSEFHFVFFDAAEIAGVVASVAEHLEVPNPITVEVDETTPLARLHVRVDGTSADSQVLMHVESGALEQTQRPRHFSQDRTAVNAGRMLLRVLDRMRDDFAGVPPDLDLSNAELAAWDAYCAGRLARLGYPMNEQRWRYNYRNRWGFSDDVDAAFDRLWSADDLGWAEIQRR
jgi:hypothetical protein